MPKSILVLKVENPHFTIRLYDYLLKIDLKGSFRNELEEALENKPVLKETIGSLLGIFVPLHIRISEINAVNIDEAGKIKITLPHRRNMVIPLEHKEDAEKLVEKINQLISKAETEKIQEIREKKRVEKEKIQENKLMNRAENKRKHKSKGTSPSSYNTVPYYFPTEQADIVDKLSRKRKKQKK